MNEQANKGGQRPFHAAAVEGFRIADMLGGADSHLGRYLHEGRPDDHQAAVEETMRSLYALNEAISILADPDSHRNAAPGAVAQLGEIAAGLSKRLQELHFDRPAEGGDDE